jgi:hypothetical protein
MPRAIVRTMASEKNGRFRTIRAAYRTSRDAASKSLKEVEMDLVISFLQPYTC